MDKSFVRKVNVLLLLLIFIDVVLSTWGFFFPGFWFEFWHGAPYVDPQALLPRSAASWTGFLLFQVIAFFKWRVSPWWLVLVAGIRFSDIFTDLTCSLFCSDITLIGRIAFPAAGLGNIIFGLLLLKFYKEAVRKLHEKGGGA